MIKLKFGISSKLIQHFYYYHRNMTGNGISLPTVIEALNRFADKSLAASWDNVGLLIEPSRPKNIHKILLTNDLTEVVMDEAEELKTDLIISYHPPIFVPLKRITNNTWKERIVLRCIENKIALYSPHTSFDAKVGGVNDWLASAFDIKSSKPIEPSSEHSAHGMGRFCILKNELTTKEAVKLVKQKLNLSDVRVAYGNIDRPITTVAICAGSGSSVLKNIEADLFVTGEMLHHDILDAVHKNISVILTNHSNSERGFLPLFSKILTDHLAELSNESVKINVSKSDKDPLETA